MSKVQWLTPDTIESYFQKHYPKSKVPEYWFGNSGYKSFQQVGLKLKEKQSTTK